GAGVAVLEERGHAQRRGARIFAEVLGFASGVDVGKIGPGLARVIRTALDQAGIGPEDLDHVNAHAGGLTDDDAWEARGIREAVGDVPVLAVKGALGN